MKAATLLCLATPALALLRPAFPHRSAQMTVQAPEAPPTSSSSESERRLPATAYYKPLQPGDMLETTAGHRALCGAAVVALLGCTAKLAAIVASTAVNPLGMAAAALIGVEFADFGSGCYHFGCDNYGNKDTPILGTQIEAFQGHHEKPWTITHRDTCNNLHKPSLAGLPPVLFFLFLVGNPYWLTWGTVAMAGIIGCQELHKWSHTVRSDATPLVRALQDANLIVSPKAHLAHHRSPFAIRYCIVTGHCNEFLDDVGFFRWLEKTIHGLTGVEPRSWTLEKFDFER